MHSAGVCVLTLLACVLWLMSFSAAQSPSSQPEKLVDALRTSFRNPPESARPMVRWWWPGGDVSDDEIARELRIIKDAGLV